MSKPAVEPVEKVPGKFFEVSGSLKDLLKPAEKKPFSLLSMFGGPEPDQVDKNQKLNSELEVGTDHITVHSIIIK